MKHLDPRQIEKPKKSPPEQQKKNRTGLFWGLSMIVIVLGLGAAGTAFFSRGAIDQVSRRGDLGASLEVRQITARVGRCRVELEQ